MRRIATLAVTVFLALTVLGAVRPAAAQAASPLQLMGPATDNYKAIWNADPEIRENRTWLAFDRVAIGDVLYWPSNTPELRDYRTDVAVTGNDGSSAVLKVTAGADVVNKPFRVEANDLFGPLLVLKDTSTLPNAPVRITLTLERNGAIIGSTVVEYRYEDDIYNAPRDSREYNSPGGRFWMGCSPTRLDWEGMPSVSADDCIDHVDPVDPVDTCSITGTAGADVLRGTSAADVICGLGGNDTLIGLGGNDTLLGGEGNDTLQGGAGDDTIDGGAGALDRASYRDAIRGIVVNLGDAQGSHPVWDGAAGDANIGWDTVVGIEAVTASNYADQIYASNRNDVLDGLGGADIIYGYAGNDRLAGGSGNDRIFGGSGADALNGQTHTDTCRPGGQAGDSKVSCER